MQADVCVETFLALETAQLGSAQFARLQRQALDTPDGPDALVRFAGHIASPLLREQVFANTFRAPKIMKKPSNGP